MNVNMMASVMNLKPRMAGFMNVSRFASFAAKWLSVGLKKLKANIMAIMYERNGKLVSIGEAFEAVSPNEIIKVVTVDDAPANWVMYHHADCGTAFRGCHPTLCPKNVYETTGKWIGLTQPKRCYCNGGECWNCWLDMIDEDLIRDPDFRHCYCGSDVCGVCNYYKSINKFQGAK